MCMTMTTIAQESRSSRGIEESTGMEEMKPCHNTGESGVLPVPGAQ